MSDRRQTTIDDRLQAAKAAVAWTTLGMAALVVTPLVTYRQALRLRTSSGARQNWALLMEAVTYGVQFLQETKAGGSQGDDEDMPYDEDTVH